MKAELAVAYNLKKRAESAKRKGLDPESEPSPAKTPELKRDVPEGKSSMKSASEIAKAIAAKSPKKYAEGGEVPAESEEHDEIDLERDYDHDDFLSDEANLKELDVEPEPEDESTKDILKRIMQRLHK